MQRSSVRRTRAFEVSHGPNSEYLHISMDNERATAFTVGNVILHACAGVDLQFPGLCRVVEKD